MIKILYYVDYDVILIYFFVFIIMQFVIWNVALSIVNFWLCFENLNQIFNSIVCTVSIDNSGFVQTYRKIVTKNTFWWEVKPNVEIY